MLGRIKPLYIFTLPFLLDTLDFYKTFYYGKFQAYTEGYPVLHQTCTCPSASSNSYSEPILFQLSQLSGLFWGEVLVPKCCLDMGFGKVVRVEARELNREFWFCLKLGKILRGFYSGGCQGESERVLFQSNHEENCSEGFNH